MAVGLLYVSGRREGFGSTLQLRSNIFSSSLLENAKLKSVLLTGFRPRTISLLINPGLFLSDSLSVFCVTREAPNGR